jgi:16S rRNA (uracil1498-N3)-methyltransferase
MQRYFAINKDLELSNSDIFHINRVMRMKINDKIEVVYDKRLFLCEIDNLDVNSVKLNVLEEKDNNNELNSGVTIAISLVNEQKWDYILQKATELGVNEIIPLELSRTLIKIDKNKADKKYERWTKICKEASEQSHRIVIPNILEIMSINDLIKTDYDLKLVCSTKGCTINLKQILSNYKNCGRILVVIGPEGGISDKEEEILVSNDFKRVSLGNFILRVETAPLFFMSAINYESMR